MYPQYIQYIVVTHQFKEVPVKRSIIMLLTLLLLGASAFAAGGKTAVVDTQAVFDKTKLGKKYQGIIREYYENRKKILDQEADDIQTMQEQYRKQLQAQALNEKARKEKEETLSKKINDFEKKRSEYSAEIEKKREDLFSDFNQVMKSVMKDIAKKEKASMIVNKSIDILGKTEVPSVLYADEDLDLTAQVITEMDKRQESREKESK